MSLRTARSRGFTLVELVVVIVIIGILAAIAIPRLSRGSSGAAEAALSADLATVRRALEIYNVEHQGDFPGPAADDFVEQLTQYTTLQGDAQDEKDSTHVYGPYLRVIPPCPVGENAGSDTADEVLISDTSPPTVNAASGEGWVYNPTTGEFVANTEQTSDSGTPFNEL